MDLSELTNRNDIGKVLDSMGLNGLGVEVGVAFGENAEVILAGSKLTKLFLIDPWNYVPGESFLGYADAIKDWQGCFDYCTAKVAPFGTRAMMVRKSSAEALEGVPDEVFDFVYIDANHMRPMIDKDLSGWWPKVKQGGIFGGHDYHMVNRPDYVCEVKAAVDEFLADKGCRIHVTTQDIDASWYVIK